MNENIYKGQIFSFFQLLKEQKIEIPIIQRDYAQGRVGKEEGEGGDKEKPPLALQ